MTQAEIYAEEYAFMAPLIGPVRTVHRLADAYDCGIKTSLDEREVPA